MDNNKRSLCSTCIHVSSCSLTSNKVFIWSCSEFEDEEITENKRLAPTIKDFDIIKNKRKLELI